MQRIQVLAQDNSATAFHMTFADALDALRLGKIEEIYDGEGVFLGVALKQTKSHAGDEFHRGSLHQSDSYISDKECRANAGLELSKKLTKAARAKVRAWPDVHDDRALVVSAGKIYQPVYA